MKRNKGKLKVTTSEPSSKPVEEKVKTPNSASKKASKYLDKSPTKKSADLSKSKEGHANLKFTKDLSDVAGGKLPHIVS